MDIKSVSSLAADHIRARIFSGDFYPGQKLPEAQLSEDLNISRTPLREAFHMLAAVGLVRNVHRKGSFVTDLSVEDCCNVYEVREMIEHYAVALLKRKKITLLPRAEEAVKKAYLKPVPSLDASPDEKLAFFEPAVKFHDVLVESTGNRRILTISASINQSLYRYQYFLLYHTPWSLKTSERDHTGVLVAIRKGEYDEAKKLLSDHFEHAKNVLLKGLEENLKDFMRPR